MIDASGESGDAAERGQCTNTDKSIHLQAEHSDHCIKFLVKEMLLMTVDQDLQSELCKYSGCLSSTIWFDLDIKVTIWFNF